MKKPIRNYVVGYTKDNDIFARKTGTMGFVCPSEGWMEKMTLLEAKKYIKEFNLHHDLAIFQLVPVKKYKAKNKV